MFDKAVTVMLNSEEKLNIYISREYLIKILFKQHLEVFKLFIGYKKILIL